MQRGAGVCTRCRYDGALVGNHFFRDHGVEYGVLIDEILENGAQFFRRKLIAERLRYFGMEDGEIVLPPRR